MVDPDVGDSSGEEDGGGKPALPFPSLSTMAKLTQARRSPSSFASSSLSRSRSCSSSMATTGEILRWNLTESFDLSGDWHVGSGELHVLVVDDSHMDRKVIERLLMISSCKMTSVDSGTRALEYLGLDGEKS
ncbi:hypothetical protein ACFXTH_040791 [Malus domestica]